MAGKETGNGAGDAAAAAPKGGSMKIVAVAAIAAVVLLALGGGVAAWLYTLNRDDKAVAEKDPKKTATPVFVDLDQFTVNLRPDPKGDDVERFIQVKLVAEMKDAASGEVLKNMMPAVRSEILLLLSSKQASELATREGKEKLAQEIIVAANKTLERSAAPNSVEHVNFTHLILQ
jgi:flagellar FliL protein